MIVVSPNLEIHQSNVSGVFKDLQPDHGIQETVVFLSPCSPSSHISLLSLFDCTRCYDVHWVTQTSCSVFYVVAQLMRLLSLGQIQIIFFIAFQSFHQCSHPQREIRLKTLWQDLAFMLFHACCILSWFMHFWSHCNSNISIWSPVLQLQDCLSLARLNWASEMSLLTAAQR